MMGIIAIITTAAAVGIALHQIVQTTIFVQERHKNASSTWGAQIHVDEDINTRTNVLLFLGQCPPSWHISIDL